MGPSSVCKSHRVLIRKTKLHFAWSRTQVRWSHAPELWTAQPHSQGSRGYPRWPNSNDPVLCHPNLWHHWLFIINPICKFHWNVFRWNSDSASQLKRSVSLNLGLAPIKCSAGLQTDIRLSKKSFRLKVLTKIWTILQFINVLIRFLSLINLFVLGVSFKTQYF